MRKKRKFWKSKINPLGLVTRQGKRLISSRLRKKITLKRALRLGLYFLAGFVILSIILFAYFSKDLPNPKKIQDRKIAQSTKIYDRDNKLLYEFHGEEKRTIIKEDQVSKYVKQATVAIEDKNFYHHPGLDVGGVIKAIGRKVLFRRSRIAGGSTITQQYIKNALLTNERTLSRKIKELILSLEIEQIYSKDEILLGYLNQIPYGNNAYGIEAASQTFLNKPAKDLNLSEAATLAALPQAPSYYLSHKDDLIGRKNHILGRMVEEKMISQKEADKAKKMAPNKDNFSLLATNIANIKAPHFVFFVRDQLIEMLGGGADAELKLQTTGYKVKTTLDSSIQAKAEEAINKNKDKITAFGGTNAALTAVDPKTGQILAMVGSVDFFNSEFGSVNVSTSPRQPGSSFKPIVYATGFKNKYNPAFTLWDLPTRLDANKTDIWPHNYDRSFNGPLTVRQALQWSLNIPAVKMLHLVGIDNAISTAQDLGITTLDKNGNYGLSLVLGSGEVKLLELTGAYSTFANNGTHNPVTSILKIEDATGKTIKEYKEAGKSVLDPQVAYQMNNVLSDDTTRSARWGRTALRLSNRKNVAAKTGTTSSYKDAWTVGYITQLAAGVWVGNNNAKPMKSGADGLIIAAPIWNSFMQSVIEEKKFPDEPFNKPDNILSLTVDRFSNKLPGESTPPDSLVTDVFASWQVPKDKDTVHIKVKIDKVTSKLATEFTPPEFVEERYYIVIHSELPDNQNWEQPVRAWAEANGFAQIPPTDKDDAHISANNPKIEITNPTNNQIVTGGNLDISARVDGIGYRINQVQFYLDNNLISTHPDPPYQTKYNVDGLSEGSYIIKVKATNDIGLSAETSVTFQVKKPVVVPTDSIPPGEVKNITLIPSHQAVTLNWQNPSDSDVELVKIYFSTESGKIGTLYPQTAQASPNLNSSLKINSLTAGEIYYFTLHPVDSHSNENQTSSQYSSTPL